MVDSPGASGEPMQNLGSCCMVHVFLVVLPEQITHFGALLRFAHKVHFQAGLVHCE